MRKFEYLAPACRAVLLYLKSVETRTGEDYPLPTIIIAMRKRGLAIGQTLAAIDEAVASQWMMKRSLPGSVPDRVALSRTASTALALQPAE